MSWPRRDMAVDLGATAAAIALNEIAIRVASEPHSRPLDAFAYTLGVAMGLPILVWRRWPLVTLLGSAGMLLVYYLLNYPGTSPAAVLPLQVALAARAGRTRWAVAVPSFFLIAGVVVVGRETADVAQLVQAFLPTAAILALNVTLGEVVRSRRALADEARERVRRAEESREREAARRAAEERLRIARELHDTLAHSMAMIAVQAGGALQVLGQGPGEVRAALTAIRETSKRTLADLRATLGVLRQGDEEGAGGAAGRAASSDGRGLDRLPALVAAVRAAGLTVDLDVTGQSTPLPPEVDHAAYRILQESLTNVLRHAGPAAHAKVRVARDVDSLRIEVRDDGVGASVPTQGGGHGLAGMRERAESLGGSFSAGPGGDGGFAVAVRLPVRMPARTGAGHEVPS